MSGTMLVWPGIAGCLLDVYRDPSIPDFLNISYVMQNYFSQAASSLACAQRGWVNIDLDKIECESCGAHLIFNALMSWSPVEGMFFLGSLFDGFTTMQSSWSLCVPVLCLFALLLTVREESTFCFE